ncbi:type IV toxin-antitoxin system YeeU family antitoxin [Escherichia coli]|nr:type IV toxin-antitoxin system YeeU family antitoxin [Escherichia coli]
MALRAGARGITACITLPTAPVSRARFSDADAIPSGPGLSAAVKQLELMLTSGELNPPISAITVTLYAQKGLTCEADTRGSCLVTFIWLFIRHPAPQPTSYPSSHLYTTRLQRT